MPFAAAITNLLFLPISGPFRDSFPPPLSHLLICLMCVILISQDLWERKPFFPVQVNMFTAAAQTGGGWDSHVTHMSSAARKPLSLATGVLNKVRARSSPFLANLPFIKPHQQWRRRLPAERTLSDARSRKLHSRQPRSGPATPATSPQ